MGELGRAKSAVLAAGVSAEVSPLGAVDHVRGRIRASGTGVAFVTAAVGVAPETVNGRWAGRRDRHVSERHSKREGTGGAPAVNVKTFTLCLALVYTALALAGLTAPLLRSAEPADTHALAVGILPLNAVHNLVHLTVGLTAFLALANPGAAMMLARALAVCFGLIAVVGILPTDDGSVLHLISTDGIWLHAVTALLAAHVGFAPPARRPRRLAARAA